MRATLGAVDLLNIQLGETMLPSNTEHTVAASPMDLDWETDLIRPSIGTDNAPQSVNDAIEKIRLKNKLNAEQSIAFGIIVRKYTDLLDARENDTVDETNSLRMFLTGPGGTGKNSCCELRKGSDGLVRESAYHSFFGTDWNCRLFDSRHHHSSRPGHQY